MQETKTRIVAVPRMHEKFSAAEGVLLFDPVGKNPEAFCPEPPLVWDVLHSGQFLADLQESTRQLARDNAVRAYDFLNYQHSLMPRMDREEDFALRCFAAREQENASAYAAAADREMRLLAQRMLLIAYHNEILYLELCAVNEKFARQQKMLKDLLDGSEEILQADFSAKDMLLPWQRVFPAFLAFCGQAEAFWINDSDMAEEITVLAEESILRENFTEYAVSKEKLLSFVPDNFKTLCRKQTYRFRIGK